MVTVVMTNFIYSFTLVMNTFMVICLLATSISYESLLSQVGAEYTDRRSSVVESAMTRCHIGRRDRGLRCPEYATISHERSRREVHLSYIEKVKDSSQYPVLNKSCFAVTWQTANRTNNFGNCVKIVTDDKFRYISSNSVPDFYMNPYCPLGVGYGYCTDDEISRDACVFPELTCGAKNGPGSTEHGDVWVPFKTTFKIPLEGDPTRCDRPWDMYDIRPVYGEKNLGDATGVAINGVIIKGPNSAGDQSIDDALFQLPCGGHVTPPLAGSNRSETGEGFGYPPLYHFHKSPECMAPFRKASLEVAKGGKQREHGQLMGWANDGFGIYSYQDVGGALPVVDECGGHFGAVDGSGGLPVYHYHSRQFAPYHLACQGPSLGKCAETQRGNNYCHPGCGADVCVQPGTDEQKLREYLAKWNPKWLDMHTVNDYKQAGTCAGGKVGEYQRGTSGAATTFPSMVYISMLIVGSLWIWY